MRVVGSWKAERIASNREPADRRRNGSEPVRDTDSVGDPQKDNRRAEQRIHVVFLGLHLDLDDAPIKGVGRISVKRINGEVHEEKNQQGETPPPATPSCTLILHDRSTLRLTPVQPLVASALERYQLCPFVVNPSLAEKGLDTSQINVLLVA